MTIFDLLKKTKLFNDDAEVASVVRFGIMDMHTGLMIRDPDSQTIPDRKYRAYAFGGRIDVTAW